MCGNCCKFTLIGIFGIYMGKTNIVRGTNGRALFAIGLMAISAMLVMGAVSANSVTVSGIPHTTFSTISAAIAAASPGATITISAGTYPEQLTITEPLTLVGVGKVIIAPTTLVANGEDADTSSPLYAIISVIGATNVNILNLNVEGTPSVSSEMAGNDEFFGIFYQDASGTVSGDTVSGIEMPTAFFGDQGGNAVFAQDGSTVKILKNIVTNYQKGGIICNDVGTYCSIQNNTVTGVGPTPLIAQNGIQLWGATGQVINNQVSGDSYQGAASSCPDEDYFAPNCWQSGGILLLNTPGTVVSNNEVSHSDVGIWSVLYYSEASTTPYVVSNNILSNNYGYGVVFDSVYGTSANNQFQGNPVGLLVTDYSANAVVTSINDQFQKNSVNNEALDAGSGFNENLVVETTGLPFSFPGPSHGHHFGQNE